MGKTWHTAHRWFVANIIVACRCDSWVVSWLPKSTTTCDCRAADFAYTDYMRWISFGRGGMGAVGMYHQLAGLCVLCGGVLSERLVAECVRSRCVYFYYLEE